jgi:hypothetical protein
LPPNSGPGASHRHDRAMTTTAVDRHRIAVLVLPGVPALEFGIATQAFAADPHYDMVICTGGRLGPVLSAGFTVTATAGLDALIGADTVIVPGYHDIDTPPQADILDALRAAHDAGARLVSICVGLLPSPPPACWTGAPRPRTGGTPTNSAGGTRRSRSSATGCTSTTATSSAPPA